MLLHPPGAGKHAEHVLDRAHVLELLHLLQEILEREAVGRELLGGLARLFFVEVLLRLLDERQDVAEVEDAAGHAVRIERLEVIQSLAGGCEQNRPAGDGCDR